MKFRVATWNVERPTTKGWKRPLKNPHIMEQIDSINADIWILTETHEVITPGDGFEVVSCESDSYHTEGECAASIWSRFPIIRQIETYNSKDSVCAEIKTPAGNLLVYGSIITYAQDKGLDGQSKLWREHYKAIEAHEMDWKKLSKLGLPLCAAGDFNETLCDTRWYGTKKGRAMLENAIDNSGMECLTKEYKIDHICLSREWANNAVAHRWSPPVVDTKPVSDHDGYHCDLMFR